MQKYQEMSKEELLVEKAALEAQRTYLSLFLHLDSCAHAHLM